MPYRCNTTRSMFPVLCSITVALASLLSESEQVTSVSGGSSSCAVKILGGEGAEIAETVARRNRFRSLGKVSNLCSVENCQICFRSE